MDNNTLQQLALAYAQKKQRDQELLDMVNSAGDALLSMPTPDNSYTGNFLSEAKAQGAGLYSGLARYAQYNLGVGGGVANYFDSVVQSNQRQDHNKYEGFSGRITNPQYWTDPQGFTRDVGGMVGSAAAFAPIAVGTAMALPEAAGAGVAGALGGALARVGLSGLGEAVASEAGANTAKWMIANVASKVPEALSEGGNSAQDIYNKTMDLDKAQTSSNEVALRNVPLLAMEGVTEVAGLKGMLGAFAVKPGGSVVANVAKSVATNVGSTFVMQGAEEMGQQIIQNNAMKRALGEQEGSWFDPNTYTPDVLDAGAAAAFGSLLLGGIGAGASLHRGYKGANTNQVVDAPTEAQPTGVVLPTGTQELLKQEEPIIEPTINPEAQNILALPDGQVQQQNIKEQPAQPNEDIKVMYQENPNNINQQEVVQQPEQPIVQAQPIQTPVVEQPTQATPQEVSQVEQTPAGEPAANDVGLFYKVEKVGNRYRVVSPENRLEGSGLTEAKAHSLAKAKTAEMLNGMVDIEVTDPDTGEKEVLKAHPVTAKTANGKRSMEFLAIPETDADNNVIWRPINKDGSPMTVKGEELGGFSSIREAKSFIRDNFNYVNKETATQVAPQEQATQQSPVEQQTQNEPKANGDVVVSKVDPNTAKAMADMPKLNKGESNITIESPEHLDAIKKLYAEKGTGKGIKLSRVERSGNMTYLVKGIDKSVPDKHVESILKNNEAIEQELRMNSGRANTATLNKEEFKVKMMEALNNFKENGEVAARAVEELDKAKKRGENPSRLAEIEKVVEQANKELKQSEDKLNQMQKILASTDFSKINSKEVSDNGQQDKNVGGERVSVNGSLLDEKTLHGSNGEGQLHSSGQSKEVVRTSNADGKTSRGLQKKSPRPSIQVERLLKNKLPEEIQSVIPELNNNPLADVLDNHLSKRNSLNIEYSQEETEANGRYDPNTHTITLFDNMKKNTLAHEIVHDIQRTAINTMNVSGEKHPHLKMANMAYKLLRACKDIRFKYDKDQQRVISELQKDSISKDNIVYYYTTHFKDKGVSIGFLNEIVNKRNDGESIVKTILQLDDGSASREVPAYAMSTVDKVEKLPQILREYLDELNNIIQSNPDSYKLMDNMTDKGMDEWKQAWNESMSDFVNRVFKTDTDGIQISDGDTSQKLNAFKRYLQSPSIVLGKNKLTKEIYLAGQAMSEAYRTLTNKYIPVIRDIFNSAKNTKLKEIAEYADKERDYADVLQVGDKYTVIDLSSDMETVEVGNKKEADAIYRDLASKHETVYREEKNGRMVFIGYDGKLFNTKEEALAERDSRIVESIKSLGYSDTDANVYLKYRKLMDEFYDLTAMVDKSQGVNPLERRSGYSPHVIEKYILTIKKAVDGEKDGKGNQVYEFVDLSSHPTQSDAVKEAQRILKENPDAKDMLIVREKNTEAKMSAAIASYDKGQITEEEFNAIKEALGYTDAQAKLNLSKTINLFPSVSKAVNSMFGRSNKAIPAVEVARTLKMSDDIDTRELADSRLIGWLEGKETVTKRQVQAFLNFTQGKHKFAEYRMSRKGNDAYIKDIEKATYVYADNVFKYLSQEPFVNKSTRLYNKAFGRTIDEDAITDLQRATKAYIADMRGIPSELDGLLNQTINDIPILRKKLSKIFGDRIATTALRNLSQLQSVTMLYLFNFSSAAMQLGSIMNINAQLDGNTSSANVGKYFGLGKNTFDAVTRATNVWMAQKGKKAWTEQSKKDLEILKAASIDLEQDLGADDFLDPYSLFNRGKFGQYLEKTGMLFRAADNFTRRVAMIGYYEKGEREYDANIKRLAGIISKYGLTKEDKTLEAFTQKGITKEIMAREKFGVRTITEEFSRRSKSSEEQNKIKKDWLLRYAKDSSHAAVFNFSNYDKPELLRMGGALGRNLLQFKQYPIKQMEFILHYLRPGGKTNNAEMRTFVSSVIMLSGLFGLPGAGALSALMAGLFGYDPEKDLKKRLMSWAGNDPAKSFIAKQILYGVGSHVGVDVSKRLGMGDFIPTKLADLLGPTYGSMHRMAETYQATPFAVDSIPLYLKAMVPAAGNYVMAAAGEARSATDGGRLGVEYNPTDRVLRAMGFIPMNEALARDKSMLIKAEEAKRKEDIKYAMEKLNMNPGDSRALSILRSYGVTAKQMRDSMDKYGKNRLDRAIENIPKKRREEYTSLAKFE